MLKGFVALPPPDPAAPGPFRLAPPGELERVLRAAGFSRIAIESRPLTFTYKSREEYWDSQRELVAPLRSATASLNSGEVARLRQAVLDAIAPNAGKDGAVKLTATPLCAVATA